MEIKVDVEAINKYMAEKLIESSIGEALEKVIKSKVENLSKGYGNPIEPVVESYINSAVRNLIEEKFKPQINEIVRKKLSDDFIESLIAKLWERFIVKY